MCECRFQEMFSCFSWNPILTPRTSKRYCIVLLDTNRSNSFISFFSKEKVSQSICPHCFRHCFYPLSIPVNFPLTLYSALERLDLPQFFGLQWHTRLTRYLSGASWQTRKLFCSPTLPHLIHSKVIRDKGASPSGCIHYLISTSLSSAFQSLFVVLRFLSSIQSRTRLVLRFSAS